MILNNFTLPTKKRNALLVNPPVYDISDFKLEYCQPTGLLKISHFLKKHGCDVSLIDCLENIESRSIINEISRSNKKIPLLHIGDSFETLLKKLLCIKFEPDEVYLTAFATYWYKSVKDSIDLIKRVFPKTKIFVGGVYPTLLPNHADKYLNADTIVVGEIQGLNNCKIDMGNYFNPKYMGLKPSKGCPNNCGYCAQGIINKNGLQYENPVAIVDEIEYNYSNNSIKQFYIFSENFLYNQAHFKTFLNEIISRNLCIKIGAPKGMEPRLLNSEILSLMKKAGWYGLRLALETNSKKHREFLGRKFNDNNNYEKAISLALKEGFSLSEIGTFLLYGTPNETMFDIRNTANYITENGSYIVPMAFTPVPGSRIFNDHTDLLLNKDLCDLMGRLYPFAEFNKLEFEDYQDLELYFAKLNQKTTLKNKGQIDLNWLEEQYAGAFARSEMAFAMNL